MMVSTLVFALTLAAGPVKVASVELSPAGNVTAEAAEFVSEHFAARLAETPGLEVTTRKAIVTLLGLERQRQLLGCADDSTSCMEELAGALGAEVVLVGELARLDRSLQANLRVMEAKTARVLHSSVVRAGTQEALLDKLDDATKEMGATLQAHFGLARPTRWQPWVLFGAGRAAAGVLAMAGGLAWYALGDSTPTVAVGVSAGAALVTLQWSFR